MLSSVRNIDSFAPGIVILDVNINEHMFCDEMDELTITATIAEGTRVISTKEALFANAQITFESIPPGDYTCSVRVEDGTGPVETMQIPCASESMCSTV